MKRVVLILSVILLSATCADAAPHRGHHSPNGGHRKPPHMIKHPPRHHHRPYYRYHYSCHCNNPYCIHRAYTDAYFRITPNFSIRVSI
ncbi:hypothetical protein IKA92_05270 [bacterium]|nr:hypothetical protein [bacterium]